MKVVNIIPTYNEIENIRRLLVELDGLAARNRQYKWATLVVDDKSPDGTGKVVRGYVAKNMRVKLLEGNKNGLGVAMCRGISYALKEIGADIVVTNEADFAYDLQLIPKMLKKIEQGWDVVIGSRHVKNGGVEGWTLNRIINHYVANRIFATWLAGTTEVSDHNGAFRAVRVRGIMDKIDWDKMRVSGFGFFNYWCFLLTRLTRKIYELPIVYQFRTKGESKVSFNPKYFTTYLRDVLEYVWLCFRIRIIRGYEGKNKKVAS